MLIFILKSSLVPLCFRRACVYHQHSQKQLKYTKTVNIVSRCSEVTSVVLVFSAQTNSERAPLWINRVYFDYATLCRMCFLTRRNVGRCPFSFLCCTLNSQRIPSSRICCKFQMSPKESLLFNR